MVSNFLSKFKRVTDSTSYIPEIDGLRFLAIFLVVVQMHITNYLDVKFFNGQLIQNSYWRDFVLEGNNGVWLFFMISGFILSLPFAKWRLQNGRKVQLKNYYLRRLTRLEPPYIIVLCILFIAQVWILHIFSFHDLLPRFFASVFYLHTVIYHRFPVVLPVAWTLEIEVQFYILAPFLCLIFLLRNKVLRWSLLLAIIVGNMFYWGNVKGTMNVFICLHSFCCGILLADLYCCRVAIIKNQKAGMLAGIAALTGLFFISSIYTVPGYCFKLACMFLLMHIALTNKYISRIFSLQLIAVIGGMCYSIYLLHFAIISAFGNVLIKSGINLSDKLYFIPFLVAFSLVVLVVSAIYFILVEKPFMKLRFSQRAKAEEKQQHVQNEKRTMQAE